MANYKVGTFVGSLASNSINRKYFEALQRLAPQAGLELIEIPIKDLPLYNSDFDDNYPAEALALKQAITDAEALLFVTPEYNRSIPGPLKNAIDWASRPWGQSVFGDKITAITGTSPGALGTSLGQRSLREVLAFLNAPTMMQPEVYLTFKPGLIDDEGVITDEGTTEFLKSFLVSFAEYIKSSQN